jgi:lipoprotein-anchoring transpeptidase ErfK/SrfK
MPRLPLAASVLALLALAPAAAAQTPPVPAPVPVPVPAPVPPPTPRIAAGIAVAGVDVSNLTLAEATAKLEPALAPAYAQTLTVAVAGKRFNLTPKAMKLEFSAAKSARRAYNTGKAAPPAAGTVTPVAPYVTFRRSATRDFAARVDRSVYVKPRDASVRITVTKIFRRKSRTGRDLDAKALRAAVEKTVADPVAPRLLKPGRKTVKPAVNGTDLARRYATVVTVDRGTFKLRLFKSYKLVKTYGVAVGAEGYDTPARLYTVTSRQVNPPWSAPNKPWAGIYAGRTVPGGSSENPLKARWLGLADGVGIHGTGDEGSIGSRASHGCIRMRVADVIALYPRVPMGTPVLIR